MKHVIKQLCQHKKLIRSVLALGLFFVAEALYADTTMSLGTMAKNMTQSFENLAKLITAGSYIAGLGFSVGAILKFKQHKDQPTQIPIGTPIGMVFIAAAMLFLPSILSVTSHTVFGPSGGTTAGPTGIDYKKL